MPIGRWVLEQACRQLGRWQAEYPLAADDLFVSVNLSARQLGRRALVAEVAQVLDDTGLDPARVDFEITESVLMDDVERSSEQLHQLHDLGVCLVVDDFGTGYSSPQLPAPLPRRPAEGRPLVRRGPRPRPGRHRHRAPPSSPWPTPSASGRRRGRRAHRAARRAPRPGLRPRPGIPPRTAPVGAGDRGAPVCTSRAEGEATSKHSGVIRLAKRGESTVLTTEPNVSCPSRDGVRRYR